MKAKKKIRGKRQESGIALLLSIFVLLLVCVVGIAMLSASGTESSLTGNYRSATSVYYAALSGLEEGRGRLLPRNPNYLGTAILPPVLPLGNVIYIANPDAGSLTAYPDTEYALEFGTSSYNPPSNVQIVPSAPTITSPPNTPNALYKWVRINAATETSLGIDVNNSGFISPVEMVYFDGTNLKRVPAAYQALEVTALAALPDKSQKILQYVVAPAKLQIPIAAALTLAAPGTVASSITLNPPSSHTFYINGTDQSEIGGSTCNPPQTPQPTLPAVGVYNNTDYTNVYNALVSPPPWRKDQYIGAGGTTPNVSPSPYIHPSNSAVDMTDPVSLSNLVQTIQGAADAALTGPATEANMPAGMSPSNPMTVVVNGDLSLNAFTGYGLLLVTGTFNYTGDSGWKGIVLVIGQGTVNENGSADGGEFDGAVFVANISGGTSLGAPTYNLSNPGGKGIYYDSCWIAQALKPISYQVLSFHEITPP